MENWIGVAVWVVVGVSVGLGMKVVVRLDETSPGHTPVLCALGAFAAVIGGMLGVGILEFDRPVALSPGGMAGAVAFAALMTFVYRWGITRLT